MLRVHLHYTAFACLFCITVSVVCFFHSISREPSKTQVFSFFQTDLGGFLPRSVVDSFFPSSMAEFYSNLAKAVKSLKDLWHQQLRNTFEPEAYWVVRPNVHLILNSHQHTEIIKQSLSSIRSNLQFMLDVHPHITVLLQEESSNSQPTYLKAVYTLKSSKIRTIHPLLWDKFSSSNLKNGNRCKLSNIFVHVLKVQNIVIFYQNDETPDISSYYNCILQCVQ